MSSDEATTRPKSVLTVRGVVFGGLWVLGAFITLFSCFASNYLKRASVPADELAIANAAMARPGSAPGAQP